MKLSDTQRTIVRGVLHRADAPLSQLSKLLGIRDHVIRRTLDGLMGAQILEKTIYVNLYKLGLTPHNLHFNLAPSDTRVRNAVLESIAKHPRVLWVGEFVGSYEYELTFLSRNTREFTTFIDYLCDKHGEVFDRTLLATEVAHNYFGFKFLSSAGMAIPVVRFEDCEIQISIDQLDVSLLRKLCVEGGKPLAAIARELKVSHSTLAYRKKRLCDEGVIVGEFYSFNRNRFPFANYNLMVSVKNGNSKFRERFLKFCASHPNIMCCHRCVGAWDYKLDSMAESKDEAKKGIDDLKNAFSSHFASIQTSFEVRVIKNQYFPLLPAESGPNT